MAEQTYYGNVKYTDGQDHDWYGTKLVIRDEHVLNKNQSKIYWSYYVWMQSASLTPYKYKYGNKVYLAFDNDILVDSENYGTHDPTGHVGEANALLYASGSTTVDHDENGEKTIKIRFRYDQTQTSTLDYVYIAANYTCDKIPQGTQITAQNTTLGSTQVITITKAIPTYTVTVGYSVMDGALQGSLGVKSNYTQFTWTPSQDIAKLDVNADTFPCKYTVETYDGDTLVATNEKTINLTLAPDVKPNLTEDLITVTPHQHYVAITGYDGYIAEKTSATVTIANIPGDNYGAKIVNVIVEAGNFATLGTELPFTDTIPSNQITKSGKFPIKCTVTNSRGRTSEATVYIDVLQYQRPQILNLKVQRCNVNGEIMPNGTYALVTGTMQIMNVGTNVPRVKVENLGQTASGFLPLKAGGDLSPKDTYQATVTIFDDLDGAQPYTLDIHDESIPIRVKPNGKAMGLGAYALDDGTINIGYEILRDGTPLIEIGTCNLTLCYSTDANFATNTNTMVFFPAQYMRVGTMVFISGSSGYVTGNTGQTSGTYYWGLSGLPYTAKKASSIMGNYDITGSFVGYLCAKGNSKVLRLAKTPSVGVTPNTNTFQTGTMVSMVTFNVSGVYEIEQTT